MSCSDDKFPKSSRLDRLRVIAVTTDTPEINEAGGNIQISLWLSDPKGENRLIDVSYKTCMDPGIVFGKDPKCGDDDQETTISGISLSSQDRTEGLNNLFSIVVPPNLLANLSTKDKFNGVSFIVSLKIKTEDEAVETFKRIRISTKAGADLNTNPSITDLTFDGAAPSFPSDKAHVKAVLGIGAQDYELIDGDDNLVKKSEELYINWYTTSGEFIPSVTEISDFSKLDLKNSPTQLTVIGVLRDSRGGVFVYKKEF